MSGGDEPRIPSGAEAGLTVTLSADGAGGVVAAPVAGPLATLPVRDRSRHELIAEHALANEPMLYATRSRYFSRKKCLR
jgi:hypothetical protein